MTSDPQDLNSHYLRVIALECAPLQWTIQDGAGPLEHGKEEGPASRGVFLICLPRIFDVA